MENSDDSNEKLENTNEQEAPIVQSSYESLDNLKHQYKDMTLETLKPLLEDANISKNQKKKITKQIKWLESVEDRRHNRKEKKKARALKRKEGGNPEVAPSKKPRKDKITTTLNFYEHVHVAVDLAFNEYMTNLDMSKLRKQIAWCYKENRRSPNPVQYHICGLTGRLKDGMDGTYSKWDVHFDENIYNTFKKEDMIYLTSDSSNVISEVCSGKVYIIGGLVDHNKHKGLTERIARENGLETGRLPLEENIDMKTRRVLTVNHVFEILLAYCELRDWKAALIRSIPQRKGASALSDKDDNKT